MARKLLVEYSEYSGAIYHVLNRGDRREPIFKDDQDRQSFCPLWPSLRQEPRQIHAYCLMGNHFHLLVGTWKHPNSTWSPA